MMFTLVATRIQLSAAYIVGLKYFGQLLLLVCLYASAVVDLVVGNAG
jgi:hypothetical protein